MSVIFYVHYLPCKVTCNFPGILVYSFQNECWLSGSSLNFFFFFFNPIRSLWNDVSSELCTFVIMAEFPKLFHWRVAVNYRPSFVKMTLSGHWTLSKFASMRKSTLVSNILNAFVFCPSHFLWTDDYPLSACATAVSASHSSTCPDSSQSDQCLLLSHDHVWPSVA